MKKTPARSLTSLDRVRLTDVVGGLTGTLDNSREDIKSTQDEVKSKLTSST